MNDKHMSDAEIVLAALDSGNWDELRRIPPQSYFTDEVNARDAWSIRRGAAPYCTPTGERIWFGATPLEALQNGARAFDLPIPGVRYPEWADTQLNVYYRTLKEISELQNLTATPEQFSRHLQRLATKALHGR